MKSEKSRVDIIGPDLLILFPYRLIGDGVNRLLPLFKGIDKQLLKANIKIAYPAYVAFIVFFSLIGGASIFVLSFLLSFLLEATLLISLLISLGLGLSCGILIFILLYLYPSLHIDSRKRSLEIELPYITSHMAVLTRASLSPEKIFRSLASLTEAGVESVAAEEAKNIVRDVHFLGYDIISAMERCIRNAPSKKFIDLIDGFISVSRSGGNLTNYFLASAKGFMDHARIAARQLIEKLGGIAELYVSMMVVFPLIVIIMLSIMGIIGGSLGGFGILSVMQIITYAIIPMMALILLLLLDSVMPPR